MDLKKIISQDESESLEFKESLKLIDCFLILFLILIGELVNRAIGKLIYWSIEFDIYFLTLYFNCSIINLR